MLRPPRRLSDTEIDELLALDVPARLATLDAAGYPHVTPLWFVWSGGAFYMTSISDRPHLRRIEVVRHEAAGRVDAPLHVDRCQIEIRVDLELNDDRSNAFLSARRHLVEVVDAVELVFDRLNDQALHLIRRGPGVVRLHDDHGKIGPRRVGTTAERQVCNESEHREGDKNHRGDDGAANRETGQPHNRRLLQ